jgi:hypothetical protein
MYTNPIFQENGQWYFWDENGDKQGPFESQEIALEELKRYFEEFL